ncbi:pilus assembly protein CpaB [Candidatus Gastranaerophilus sp. (ex Termes propinquus)]|nr:pilus assembly protein CpaB [Candidatus Gastranaerophilus sp. (ex Termes propinquus)]
MNVKKNKNQFITSVIIGIAIFGLSFLFFTSQQQQIDELKKAKAAPQAPRIRNYYVITKVDLKKGSTITADSVYIDEVPITEAKAFKSKDDIVGLTLIRDIGQKQILTRDFFQEEDLASNLEPQKGFRAVSLVMGSKSYTPPLKPATYIDLYSTGGSLTMENIKVLDMKNTKSDKVVVLEIKEENVSSFVGVIAQEKERFIIVQKNQTDDKTYKFKYDPQVAELERIRALPDLAPSSVVNYNIEEFTINEAPPTKKQNTVEIIRGTNKTEYEF